jgi:hypothetical protein
MKRFDYSYDISRPGYGGTAIHASIDQAAEQLMTLSTPFVFLREQGTARWWRFERDGGYLLMNDPQRRRHGTQFTNDRQRQSVLFTGRDCLAGQTDLFDDAH